MDSLNRAKWYDRNASQAKFLLGGIGAGNISIGSRGQLCDWEIMNSPNIGYNPPYSFFAIRAEWEGRVVSKILESEFVPPFERSHGIYSWDMGGAPRFKHSRICGRCGTVRVELRDPGIPLEVALEGFSPLIPLDADNSGIPAANIRYVIKNTGTVPAAVSVCGNMANLAGFVEKELFGSNVMKGNPKNEVRRDGKIQGVYCSTDLPGEDLKYGSMALTAVNGRCDVSVRRQWLNGNWWDGAHDFWDDFICDGMLEEDALDNALDSDLKANNGKLLVGAVCEKAVLGPGEEGVFDFIISWYFPNRESKWRGNVFPPEIEINDEIVKNYYTNLFKDAWDVSRYLADKYEYLKGLTLKFEDALFSSTLPDVMIDAAAANITVLRSTTCFRLANGKFFGWEGTFNHRGSCEGNCTHVWSYEQTLAFLFPALELDMRRTEFLIETNDDGSMPFRTSRALGNREFTLFKTAPDGQLGCVIGLYREWMLSGDDRIIDEMWDKVLLVMNHAFTNWDRDGDCMIDGGQHSGYDVEFYGLSPLANSVFYAALLAAAAMADYKGEAAMAEKFRDAWRKGSRKMDELLYNGSYYIQKLENFADYKYQFGTGCFVDQIMGQELANVSGLGYILPGEHVKSAYRAIYENNYRPSLDGYLNVQRAYAVNDEGGLLLCTWKEGERPRFPFPYSDEVWTGLEYHVAAALIYEGYIEEAENIVKTARGRHDGFKRNPWNEIECGNHYVRSMASWELLLASSGYRFNLRKNEIGFSPKINQDNFRCFFSTAKSWGVYTQQRDRNGDLVRHIEVLYGDRSVKLME
ncbi:MAG: hypothetical protein LBS06_04730 [Treponema sp.]|nr:hypothetical protein [Treponema sp.]